MDMRRVKTISSSEFRSLLLSKKIRAASLEDVNGTHHKRALCRHPNTGQWYVWVK